MKSLCTGSEFFKTHSVNLKNLKHKISYHKIFENDEKKLKQLDKSTFIGHIHIQSTLEWSFWKAHFIVVLHCAHAQAQLSAKSKKWVL